MKKENKKVDKKESTSNKKDLVKFIYQTKNVASKKFSINTNLRTQNYVNEAKEGFIYGLR